MQQGQTAVPYGPRNLVACVGVILLLIPFAAMAGELPPMDAAEVLGRAQEAGAWLESASFEAAVTRERLGSGRSIRHELMFAQEGDPLEGGRVCWNGEVTARGADGHVWEPACHVTRGMLGRDLTVGPVVEVRGKMLSDKASLRMGVDTHLPSRWAEFLEDLKFGLFLEGFVGGLHGKSLPKALLADGIGTVCREVEEAGRACYLVEGRIPLGLVSLWVCPELGYTLLKYRLDKDLSYEPMKSPWNAMGAHSERLVCELSDVEVVEIEGRSVPVAGRLVFLAEEGGTTNAALCCTVRRSGVKTSVAEDLFSLDAPDGTLVAVAGDQERPRVWRDGEIALPSEAGPLGQLAAKREDVREALDGALAEVASSAPEPTWPLFLQLVACLTALAFGGGVYVGVRANTSSLRPEDG